MRPLSFSENAWKSCCTSGELEVNNNYKQEIFWDYHFFLFAKPQCLMPNDPISDVSTVAIVRYMPIRRPRSHRMLSVRDSGVNERRINVSQIPET